MPVINHLYQKLGDDQAPKVTIIIPALNEEAAIGSVVTHIRQVMHKTNIDYEILVIDDGSTDQTGLMALEAGAEVIRHAYNLGYGAATKTGIRNAAGNVLVTIDGDGQHDAADIPRLLAELDHYGMVVGARTKASQTEWHRDVANTIYSLLASYICNCPIPDLTSGLRAMRMDLARSFLYLLPNTFSSSTTLTLATIRTGHCVKYIPITTKLRTGKSKIRLAEDGLKFLVIIFKIATLFSPLKIFLPISAILFLLGSGWYLYTLLFIAVHFPPMATMLLLSSVFVFLIGLVSEQIAQLRFDRSEQIFNQDRRDIEP